MYLKGVDGLWIKLTGFGPEKAEKLGAKWSRKEGAWLVPYNLESLREVYKELNIIHKKMLKPIGEELSKQITKIKELKEAEDVPGHEKLRPYQRVDVNYLKKRPYAGIFNEQRTGKTPTSIVLTKELGYMLNVVVCPATLVYNWKGEIETWNKDAAVMILNQTKKKRETTLKEYVRLSESNEKSQVYIVVSYETLSNDLDIFHENICSPNLDFCLLVDEAHRLDSLSKGKNASTQSQKLSFFGRFANRRYALTGTPSRSNGHDAWGILHFLNPERWPGYWQFVDRYFEKHNNYWGGKVVGKPIQHRKKELQHVFDVVSTQRKREEVMKWLPQKQYQRIDLPFKPKQYKVYKDVLDTFEYMEDGKLKVDSPNIMSQLIRLRQVCLDPALLDIKAPSAKLEALYEWLKDNPDEQVVVFSQFTSGLKTLFEELGKKEKVGMIHGEMDGEERQRSVERFQRGNIRILLANIVAAGTGITLDKARTAIFLDRSFVPIENEQAEDRIIPVSQERNHSCTIIDFVMRNSVEERIHGLLSEKKDIIKLINNYGVKEILT